MLEHEEWRDHEDCRQKRLQFFTNLIRVSKYCTKAQQDTPHLTVILRVEIEYVCITENSETHERD